jgi:hypothetical protein
MTANTYVTHVTLIKTKQHCLVDDITRSFMKTKYIVDKLTSIGFGGG